MNSISSHGAEVRSIRKLLLKINNMSKVKSNAAEITLTVITIIVLMSSCGGNHYTCPSYGNSNINQNTNINA